MKPINKQQARWTNVKDNCKTKYKKKKILKKTN